MGSTGRRRAFPKFQTEIFVEARPMTPAEVIFKERVEQKLWGAPSHHFAGRVGSQAARPVGVAFSNLKPRYDLARSALRRVA